MQASNLSDAEFKTLVIKTLNELREDLKSIKKIQSEMKDTLIEIKDNLHGDHSTVGEDKNQINNLNIRKQKKSNQNKKKKELGF